MAQAKTRETTVAKPQKGGTEIAVRSEPSRHMKMLRPVTGWEHELNRLVEDFRRHFGVPSLWGRDLWPTEEGEFRAPSVDVFEEKDDVVVKAELPGMSKDQVQVTLSDSTLTIEGEKKRKEEIKKVDYYYCERSFGSFSRTVDLPCAVKTDAAKATFVDGVLEVRLPKTDAAKRRAVKVAVR